MATDSDVTQCCDNCYFVRKGAIQKDLSRDRFCRRFPPTLTMRGMPNGEVQMLSNFPPVNQDVWCGEWAPDETVTRQ